MQEDCPDHTYRCVCGGGMHIDPFLAGRLVICSRCDTPVIVPKTLGNLAVEFQPDLRTARLEMPLAWPKDVDRLLPITSDPANFRYEVTEPDSRTDLLRHLRESRFPRGFRRSKRLSFLLVTKENETVVGTISLSLDSRHSGGTVGVMVHHPYHNRGFGTEAIREVKELGLHTLNLRKVSAVCDGANRACVRAFEKAGFRPEGCLRDVVPHLKRGWIDFIYLAAFHPDALAEQSGRPVDLQPKT